MVSKASLTFVKVKSEDLLFCLQNYRKISNIRRTKSQNLNVSRFILQLFVPNPMKPGVKLEMKM